jgi:hypothetical protein
MDDPCAREEEMGTYYDQADIPDELRRGFDGRFSIAAEIIVAIPPALARDIVRQRGWLFPLPPAMLDKVRARRPSP